MEAVVTSPSTNPRSPGCTPCPPSGSLHSLSRAATAGKRIIRPPKLTVRHSSLAVEAGVQGLDRPLRYTRRLRAVLDAGTVGNPCGAGRPRRPDQPVHPSHLRRFTLLR